MAVSPRYVKTCDNLDRCLHTFFATMYYAPSGKTDQQTLWGIALLWLSCCKICF